jgi:hypothetical protein
MDKAELLHLLQEAGFVFKARVVRQGSPDVRLANTEEGKSLTVEIGEIFRSTQVLSSLRGKQAVVLSKETAGAEEGAPLVLFTNCLVLGNQIVLEEVGQIKASREVERDLQQAVKTMEEQPLERRVAGADAVITGKVLSTHRVEEPSIYRSEHDPDWWIARVQVLSALKGKVNGEIDVLYPNSTDIAWYKAPKLHEGVSGILLLWRGKETEALPEKARGMYQVFDPLDLLSMDRLEDVQRLLGTEKRGR